MCGIVGLYVKNPEMQPTLGRWLSAMLVEMGERGPDSAGFAVYGEPAPNGAVKFTMYHADPAYRWAALAADMAAELDVTADGEQRDDHFVLSTGADAGTARRWIGARDPEIAIASVGSAIEIFKAVGRPEDVSARYRLTDVGGTHGIGHTRMATESAVTAEHSHPFSTGVDVCLVHNGSLSNYNLLRRSLQRRGVAFQSDNDTEVAAGYIADQMSGGATLDEALAGSLADLDGFFTFAVGTRDGFAVMRDHFACKPAVLAETDDWVAMASEYRSVAPLPGADQATIWEPEPATIYSWGRD